MKLSFADILAPITPEQFFAEYYDKKPLHVPGVRAKFVEVMNWRSMNDLLNMTHIWSPHSLKLVLDGTVLPAEQYMASATNRDGQSSMQPVTAKVHELIRRGASVVLNDIDSLTPGLRALSDALEGAGLGRSQANLYCSWRDHKAFPAHFDTHDVWAIHVEGEKTWNIWEGRADWPVMHAFFRNMGQAYHDRTRGALKEQIVLKPGDLLYLPRGWYHDALCESDACIHIAFGVHAPLGLDVMSILSDRAVHDVLFRQPLPRADGIQGKFALHERLRELGRRLRDMLHEPKVVEVVEKFAANYRFHRGGYDVPFVRTGIRPPEDDMPGAPAMSGSTSAAASASVAAGGDGAAGPARYRVAVAGARAVRRGQDWALRAGAAMIPLAGAEADAAQWVLARSDFAAADLGAAFPGLDRAGFLGKLAEAGVLVAAD
ncbi:MAG: hypothetical protein IT557_16550 [Alphaproteobacteria bacterium]|nr:hypothetical protein [Alphaproteobacteria bacterium]